MPQRNSGASTTEAPLLWNLWHASTTEPLCPNWRVHAPQWDILLDATKILCATTMTPLNQIHKQTLKKWNHLQSSSITQSCPTLCDPMNRSTPGLPVHHQLPDFSDAIQPSHPLSSPSPPALNLSQHQGLFKWVSSFHQVVKVLEFQLQHQSFQWIFRTDFL